MLFTDAVFDPSTSWIYVGKEKNVIETTLFTLRKDIHHGIVGEDETAWLKYWCVKTSGPFHCHLLSFLKLRENNQKFHINNLSFSHHWGGLHKFNMLIFRWNSVWIGIWLTVLKYDPLQSRLKRIASLSIHSGWKLLTSTLSICSWSGSLDGKTHWQQQSEWGNEARGSSSN